MMPDPVMCNSCLNYPNILELSRKTMQLGNFVFWNKRASCCSMLTLFSPPHHMEFSQVFQTDLFWIEQTLENFLGKYRICLLNHWSSLSCNSWLTNQKNFKKKLEQKTPCAKLCNLLYVYFLEYARAMQIIFVKNSPGTMYKLDSKSRKFIL